MFLVRSLGKDRGEIYFELGDILKLQQALFCIVDVFNFTGRKFFSRKLLARVFSWAKVNIRSSMQ